MTQKIKKLFSFITGIAIVVSVFSPLSLSMAQSNSTSGELTNATIAGSASIQHVGQSSSAAKRTVSWTRTAYDGAVNIYYAHDADITGGCSNPDPADSDWQVTSGVNSVGSTFVWAGAEIVALPNGTDYCLLIRSSAAATPWAVTDQFEIDNTVPTITARQTQDLDGDGKIDAIKITFDDDILDSTVTASNFDVAGYNGEAFASTTNGDVANDNVIYITFTEGGTSDSNATPNVTYTAGTLTDLADNALASNGPTAAADLAKPVITTSQWLDATGDGNIDRVTLTFSEQVDITDTGAGFGAIFLSDGSAITIDDADYTASDTTTLTLNFTGDPITGTAITGLTVTYSDAGTNTILDNATGTPNEIANGDVAETYTDGALPVFLSSTTADLDGNGTVDQATIVYSEHVSIVDADGGAFDGVTFGNSCVAAAANYSSADTNTSTVVLTGCTAGDTSITANPTYDFGAGEIKDLSAAHNEMGNAETVTGTDGAAPAIISSAGSDSDNDGKTNSYTITFSENLTDKGAAASNANFTARNATTLADIKIDTVGIGLTATGNAKNVALNLDDTDTDNYTGIIDFSYNSAGGGAIIEDASAGTTVDYGNKTNVALTDDVLPVLLSSRGGNIGGTADVLDAAGEILDFAFSEPINSTTPTIVELEAGLLFAGATDGTNLGGGTNTVTRVTTSITGDTYRVTRVDTDSTNLITPGTDTVKVTLGTNIKDTTGNIANTVPAAVTIAVADISPPTFTSRETQDLNVNGKIDAIKITMNESIVDSTITIANFTTDHVGGVDATYSGTIGGIVFVNGISTGATPNDAVFYVKIGEHATGDTDATPALTYTAGTLADSSNNLVVTASAAATDKAAPAAMSAVYKDTGVADGQVDSVDITFSEPITLTAYADGDWSVSTPGTVIALANETAASAATNVITLTALGAANKTGGGTNPEITYTAGTNVNDGLGNNTATFTIAATDDAAPIVVSKKYIDVNGNGQVDSVELTLSEDQATCSAEPVDFSYVANDITGSAIAGPSAGVICSTNKVTITLGVAGDANITSHTTAPTIAYLDDATREISDAGGHQLATFGAVNLADGAGPVVTAISITDANSDGKMDRADITYSEALQDTAAAANGFDVTSVANHGTCDTESANPDGTANLVTTFACANQYTAIGDLVIGFTSNAGVLDAAGNNAPSVSLTSASTPVLVDNAKPVMVSAATKDNDHNGTIDGLQIVFSEPVNITDGGTDDDITLVASSGTATIVAGDYNASSVTTLNYVVLPSVTGDTSLTITPTYATAGAGSIADIATVPNEMNNANTIAGIDGAEPVILNTAFTDANADGNIDRAVLTFSEQVDVADGNAGNGLDSIVINDGASLAIDNADYAASNTTTLTLNFADHTGTAITGLTVTYDNAGSNAITDNAAAPNEIFDTGVSVAYTDNAAPVPMTASINKAISNYNLQNGSVIDVTFSEDVTPTGVANGDWKFSRNGFEALASANWPDGAGIGYSGSTNKITMTLTGPTTSNTWMFGAKMNLSADNIAHIVDGSANQADMKGADIAIAGLNGPVVDFVGQSNLTATSVTISWTTGVNTTSNKVFYDTKANFETDHSLDLQSVVGTPGEGTRNHSVNLSSLTASTTYYYKVCSTESSESCASGQFTTNSAGDATAPVISDQAPSIGDTGVSINPEDLYVQFDEALDPTTVGSSNVMLCRVTDATCTTPVSVGSPMLMENGTLIRIGGPGVTLSYGTEYWIKVTTGVKNLAGLALAAPYGSTTTSNFTTAAAPIGALAVTGTSMNEAKRFATGATFDTGWEWYIDLTIPTTEPSVRLKFGNLTGTGGTIAAASNVRYYSAHAIAGHTTSGTAIVAADNDYSVDGLTFDATSDQDATTAGWQVRVKVQAQNPSSLGGSFSTQFSVQSSH